MGKVVLSQAQQVDAGEAGDGQVRAVRLADDVEEAEGGE